jgi:hypothetical protein
MNGLTCAAAGLLPGDRWPALSEHRRRCLRCQAAAARGRALGRDLAALSGELVAAPPGLRDAVVSGLGEQDAADPRRALAARAAARYAAVTGVVTATLVALLAGLARRHSRAMG